MALKLVDRETLTTSITSSLEVHLARSCGAKADVTSGWILRCCRFLDSVRSNAWNPSTAGNHLTLGECSCLVGANIGNTTESLQGLEVTDDDISRDHGFGPRCHSNCEHNDQTSWNHGQACRDSVNDDFLARTELVGCKDNNGTNNSDEEEQYC